MRATAAQPSVKRKTESKSITSGNIKKGERGELPVAIERAFLARNLGEMVVVCRGGGG